MIRTHSCSRADAGQQIQWARAFIWREFLRLRQKRLRRHLWQARCQSWTSWWLAAGLQQEEWLQGDSNNWFSKMYHNYSRSQRFQILIFQDAPRFQKMIFRDVIRFQVSYPTLSKTYPICFEIISDLLGFTEISRSSKIIQDFKDFIDIPRCWFPVFSNHQ